MKKTIPTHHFVNPKCSVYFRDDIGGRTRTRRRRRRKGKKKINVGKLVYFL